MSFVGSAKGPRKSEIVAKLGPGYFGISPEDWDRELEDCRDDEQRGIVDPVYVD